MAQAHLSIEGQTLGTPARHNNKFVFPENTHLLITTQRQICAWDSAGINTILQSKKNGIVAAREAQDETGVIAVADRHVVVLHDTKRGHDKSWGLEANDDEVRCLEYTADAKSLFLSTNLTADIQCYSTGQERILSSTRSHASSPTALAVSSTGHLMVSASDSPPVVHLNNLAYNTATVLIEPRASKAAVSVVSFHPERPKIFLLAFRDGTIATYDATNITRSKNGSISNQESVNKGEIAHLKALHRPAPVGNKTAAITGAAFLPGFKNRAVSVGSDGRCRIVDFSDGGVILRTWHAKAPLTSVAVLARKLSTQARNRSAETRASHVIGGPTSTDSLIAIGRSDGQIHIYDSVGLLLTQCNVSEDGKSIISVDWVRGSSPKQIVNKSMPITLEQTPPAYSADDNECERSAKAQQDLQVNVNASARPRRDTLFEHIGLPPGLRRPKGQTPHQTTNGPPRKFTIHPDEVEDGTVRRTALSQSSKASGVQKGDYLDLFSPVKPAENKLSDQIEKRIASPPRSRPAITSQTFVKSPEPAPTTTHDTVSRSRNLALFPSTDSGTETARRSETTVKTATKVDATKLHSSMRKKRIAFKNDSRRSSSFKTASTLPNHNAKVLADLRKMNAVHPAHRPSGTLSSFKAPNISQKNSNVALPRKENRINFLHRPLDHVETHLDSDTARKAYEHAHAGRNWPEDSNQDPSLDGDIWVTSASGDEMKYSRRRKKFDAQRPSARQMSRSRVTSKGTMSTLATQPGDVASASAQRLHRLDGSTEDEMFTAGTHVTSSGTLSPSSRDVRELFPRSSSLSPKKGRKSIKRPQRSRGVKNQALKEVEPNETAGRMTKSPWARARAGKVAKSGFDESCKPRHPEPIEVYDDPTCATDGQKESAPEAHCAICGPTRTRVKELEAEVARLKGEMLMFKSMLRRQGMPLPVTIR